MKTNELEILAQLAGAFIGDRLPLPGEAITLTTNGVTRRFDLRELHTAKEAALAAITEEVATNGIHRTQNSAAG